MRLPAGRRGMQQYKGVKMADVHASDDALAGTEAVKVDFRRNRCALRRVCPSLRSRSPQLDAAAADAGPSCVSRYPCAVVWQPFPPLTWLIPCIGHTGITDSQGVVHDFQGEQPL